MKVLLTVTNYPPFSGGLGVYVQNLAEQLSADGHEVTVLTMQGDKPLEETRGQVRVVVIPRQFSYRDVFAMPLASASRALLEDEIRRADVVNAHTRYFPLTFLTVVTARKAGVPVIVTEHGGGFVSASSPLTVAGAWLADLTIGRWSLRNCTKVLSVSAKSREFVKKLSGVEAEVVGNGLDLVFWSRKKAVGDQQVVVPSDRVKNVVFIGRLVKEKGWSLLLRAWQAIPASTRDGYRLVFVGDGPDLSKLRKAITNSSLVDVISLGQQPKTLVRDLLCSGVLVNPSSAAEGFQTTLLEARALGTYVVTSPVGGAAETVTEKGTGVVIESRDVDAWSKGIQESLGKAGVAVGQGHVDQYGWSRVAEVTSQAFERAATTKSAVGNS